MFTKLQTNSINLLCKLVLPSCFFRLFAYAFRLSPNNLNPTGYVNFGFKHKYQISDKQ